MHRKGMQEEYTIKTLVFDLVNNLNPLKSIKITFTRDVKSRFKVKRSFAKVRDLTCGEINPRVQLIVKKRFVMADK